MSREQIVRDVAYAIWEAEGKPQGRDVEHWRLAEQRVAASLAGGSAKAGTKTQAKPPAKAKARNAPAAKAPASPAAEKAASRKKT